MIVFAHLEANPTSEGHYTRNHQFANLPKRAVLDSLPAVFLDEAKTGESLKNRLTVPNYHAETS